MEEVYYAELTVELQTVHGDWTHIADSQCFSRESHALQVKSYKKDYKSDKKFTYRLIEHVRVSTREISSL